MATFDYTEMRDVAEELIEEFGQAATIVRLTKTGPEWAPVEGQVAYPVMLVDVEQFAKSADGSLAQESTHHVLISTKDLAIEVSSQDSITIGGKTHAIEDLAAIAPGGLTLLWEARLGAAGA